MSQDDEDDQQYYGDNPQRNRNQHNTNQHNTNNRTNNRNINQSSNSSNVRHNQPRRRDTRDYSQTRPNEGELSLREIEDLIFRRYQQPKLTAELPRIPQPQWLSIKRFNQLMNTPYPEQVAWTHSQPIMIPLTMACEFHDRLKCVQDIRYQGEKERMFQFWLKTPIDARFKWIMYMNEKEWRTNVRKNRIDYMDCPWKSKNTLRVCYEYRTGKRVPVQYLIEEALKDKEFKIVRLYQNRDYVPRMGRLMTTEINWINYKPYDPSEWYGVAGHGQDIDVMIFWRESGRPTWRRFIELWRRETTSTNGRFYQGGRGRRGRRR